MKKISLENIIKSAKNVTVGLMLVGLGYGLGYTHHYVNNYFKQYYEPGLLGFKEERIYRFKGGFYIQKHIYDNHYEGTIILKKKPYGKKKPKKPKPNV